MSKSREPTDWRESRRQSARIAIVDAAWAAVRDEGLAALSLRDLARRAGITTPTVYAYFESKDAIYDAMFGQAAEDFAALMARSYGFDDPHDLLMAGLHRFVEFCTGDLPRYQLLFQRTIPGFRALGRVLRPGGPGFGRGPWAPGEKRGNRPPTSRPVDGVNHGPGRPTGLQ